MTEQKRVANGKQIQQNNLDFFSQAWRDQSTKAKGHIQTSQTKRTNICW